LLDAVDTGSVQTASIPDVQDATGRTLDAQDSGSVHEKHNVLCGLDALDAVDAVLHDCSDDAVDDDVVDIDWLEESHL
jgi:hypothetical protein